METLPWLSREPANACPSALELASPMITHISVLILTLFIRCVCVCSQRQSSARTWSYAISQGQKQEGVYVLVFLPSICVTELSKISCVDKPNHIPICINKVLLAYSYTHSFVYCRSWPLCGSCKFSDSNAENTCVSPKAFNTVWSLAGNMCQPGTGNHQSH